MPPFVEVHGRDARAIFAELYGRDARATFAVVYSRLVASDKRIFRLSEPSLSNVLEIIPLGGIGEFGMNCTLLRFGDEMLVLDAGMGFPEESA